MSKRKTQFSLNPVASAQAARQKSISYQSNFSPRAVSNSTNVSAMAEDSPHPCHVKKDSFKVTQGEWTEPQKMDNGNYKMSKHITVTADFENDDDAKCESCEYRQFIKGYFKHTNPGSNNWITDFNYSNYHEDVCTGGFNYGHRDAEEGKHCTDAYTPNRKTGCHYEATDDPGIGGLGLLPGAQYDINEQFEGRIIDTTGKIIKTKNWTVKKKGILPAT